MNDMPNDAPLRGADVVNDELEVGFDAGFEARWRRVELSGRVVMGAFVAAALAGLFGQGPFSHRTARAADGRFSVDYEPVTRYGTATLVTLHLAHAAAGADGTAPVHVFLDTKIVEPMGLQDILPEPANATPEHAGIDYTFDLPSNEADALVRLNVHPTAFGPVRLFARQDGATVTWTQWVLP